MSASPQLQAAQPQPTFKHKRFTWLRAVEDATGHTMSLRLKMLFLVLHGYVRSPMGWSLDCGILADLCCYSTRTLTKAIDEGVKKGWIDAVRQQAPGGQLGCYRFYLSGPGFEELEAQKEPVEPVMARSERSAPLYSIIHNEKQEQEKEDIQGYVVLESTGAPDVVEAPTQAHIEAPQEESPCNSSFLQIFTVPGGDIVQSAPTHPPVESVVDGGSLATDEDKSPKEEKEEEMQGRCTPDAGPIPWWLDGTKPKALTKRERASKRYVWNTMRLCGWQPSKQAARHLWHWVPRQVLEWAAEEAQAQAERAAAGAAQRQAWLLPRQLRYKISDWAKGDNGPGMRRKGAATVRHEPTPSYWNLPEGQKRLTTADLLGLAADGEVKS